MEDKFKCPRSEKRDGVGKGMTCKEAIQRGSPRPVRALKVMLGFLAFIPRAMGRVLT